MVRPFSVFTQTLLLLLASTVVCQGNATEPSSSEIQDRAERELVLGIHLSQSYATIVADLPNGTVVNIAKVDGTPAYINFVQRELNKRQRSWWNSYLYRNQYGHERFVWWKKLIGIPTWRDILSEMLLPLRNAAEEVLDNPFPSNIYITVPAMDTWIDDYNVDEYIPNAAARQSGISVAVYDIMGTIYLPEINAVLAANGRQLCREEWCAWPDGGYNENDEIMVYYISITNSSIYTAIAPTCCLSYANFEYISGEILPLSDFQTDTKLLSTKFEKHLMSKLNRLCRVGGCNPDDGGYLVLLAGEEASSEEYISIVERVADSMRQDVRFNSSKIEFLVSEDPTYAAAKGAAIWARTRMGDHDCTAYHDKNDGIQQSGTEQGSKIERDEL